jgi:type IV secretion system protein VirB6
MANYVDSILASIDTVSNGLVKAVYGGLSAELGTFIPSVLVILITIFGLAMMLGFVQYPVRDFIKKTVAALLVFTLVTNWSWFDLVFYNMFTKSPDAIGGIILSSAGYTSPGGMGTKLGELFEMGIVASGKGFSSSGMFMPIVIGVAIFIATLLVCGFAIALLCLAKIGMAVVLSIGPIFIFFTLFSATRGMFSSWLQQCFNYGLIAILTYVIMAFLMTIINQALAVIPDTDPTIADISPLCIISFVGCFVFWQVPQTAAGLAGGAQLTTMGAFSSAANKLARGRGSFYKSVGGSGKAVGNGIRNIYNRARRGSIRKN